MSRNRVYLALQAVLCVALAALLAAGAADIYREGMAMRQSGDSLAWIYTREKVAERFWPIAPLLFASIGLAAAGLLLGIRDERYGRPARDVRMTRDLAREPGKPGALRTARVALVVIAAAFIALGILNGGVRDVLVKAINICTECVGLG